jgi:AraC-like DNA-binding protein
MLLIESFLTISMITILLIIAIFSLRDARHLLQGRLLAALSISVAALYLSVIPAIFELPKALYIMARILSSIHLGLLWWFCLSLLKDDFRINKNEWFGMAVLSFAPVIYVIELFDVHIPFWKAINIWGGVMPFALVAHIILIAVSERNNDLVEPRRKARFWLTLGLMLASFISVLSEYIDSSFIELITRNLFALPIILTFIFWLTRLDPDALSFKQQKEIVPKPLEINPKDTALYRDLIDVMEKQLLFKEHGLSINKLAIQLGTQEHRLRSLINQGIGFRNFSNFLSSYRIKHAKQLLSEPKNARLPILSISLDSGFTSLQTFNRVFKEHENCAPSFFRKQALGKTAQI